MKTYRKVVLIWWSNFGRQFIKGHFLKVRSTGEKEPKIWENNLADIYDGKVWNDFNSE